MASSRNSESQEWRENAVPVKIMRIIFGRYEMHQSILLREIDGSRELALYVSYVEAMGIERKLREEYAPRPFTHDLICQTVAILGGSFMDAKIHDVQGGTYYAKLRLRQERRILTLDSRPSDMIAIALSCKPKLEILVKADLLHSPA